MKNTANSTNTPVVPSVRYMDIWMADLPVIPGHVKHGTRPVVIVNNDDTNAASPILTVVPLTTKRRMVTQATHVCLHGYGLTSTSIAQCEQVMALDRICLIRRMGQVNGWYDRLAIQHGLAKHLGIELCINLAA